MAKGCKISGKVREQVIALYASGEGYTQIAKKTKISRTAVSRIVKDYKENEPDELERLRHEKTVLFINDATDVVADLFTVLKRRAKTIIEDEDKLDEIIDAIDDLDMSEKKKTGLICKMSALMSPKLTELTTAFGTVYDKLVTMTDRNGSDSDEGGVVQIMQTINLTPPEDEDDE